MPGCPNGLAPPRPRRRGCTSRDRLRSADSEIVLAALVALATMRDRDAVPRVLPLLTHKEVRVRIKAIEFLGWSRDERAVDPLAEILDVNAPHYPERHALANAAATALGQIGCVEILPRLERAACQGVERATYAVGHLGGEASFDILLSALERNPQRCAAIDSALYLLVGRSNKSAEPWMTISTRTQPIQIARIPGWRSWWDRNRHDFKVTKSIDEALVEGIQLVPRLTPGWDPSDRRVLALVAYFKRHGVTLVNNDADRWRVVEPEPPEGHDVTVSIKTFPKNATEAQMQFALMEINIHYDLNVPAHLATCFAALGGKSGRPEAPSPALRKRLQELFERYDPADGR